MYDYELQFNLDAQPAFAHRDQLMRCGRAICLRKGP